MRLQEIVAGIRPVDSAWIERAAAHSARLVMPHRALGRLHAIAEQLCGIGQTLRPSVASKAILVMAADHGVAAAGVSAYPQEVTGEMVKTFLRGGAAINAIARAVGAEVRVVDMGIIPELDPALLDGGDRLRVRKVARGTRNMLRGAAMTREQAAEAVLAGFDAAAECFQRGVQLLGTGDMGIGNTTPSAAIGAVLAGRDPEAMAGRGTGVDADGLRRKREAIREAIRVNRPDPGDGLDVLAKLGGFEIAAIAGCALAGAHHRVPVVVDGFISTAGALIAQALCPAVTGYLLAGHRSAEAGHQAMLDHLGLEPLLDLGMRLGEGTGAALAMSVIQGAVAVFNEVFSFEQAGVSGKEGG
ncbi:MAG: nicotinate-nucleotide--dimethylbenzimidazole phosphoribosyltransferase [bacterium]